MSEQKVVLLIGLPGAGKSTWLENIGANAISSDAIRKLLADDEGDQTIHKTVFGVARYLLRRRIELGRPVTYIDATNVTRRVRKLFIDTAKERQCRVEAIWFDVPLAVCKARNANRERRVPDFVLDWMAAILVPPSYEEGFDHLMRV